MNKQQIKAELRRSACEDEDPLDISKDVWTFVCDEGYRKQFIDYYDETDAEKVRDYYRIFFLLVAESL